MPGPWEQYQEKKPWEQYTAFPEEITPPVETIKPVDPAIKAEPEESGESWLERLQTSVEPAMAIGSAMIAEPVAGLGGLATLATGGTAAEATKTIEETKKAMTYQPRTEGGKEAMQTVGETLAPIGKALQTAEEFLGDIGYEIGGPTGGALGATMPTAAMELLGLKGIRTARGSRKVTGIPDSAVDDLKAKGVDIDDISDEGLAKVQQQAKTDAIGKAEEVRPPEQKQYQTILRDIERKKTKKAAGDVAPDKEIMDAAAELGIDLNPGHYSTNKAYMEVEQSLKSRPGSTLSAKELKAINELGARADSLIKDLGGTTDKSLLDLKVKNEISGSIEELSVKSDKAYTNVDAAIPKSTIVNAPSSKAYISQVLEDLGGDVERLSPAEKDLFKLSQKEKVTYAALDRLRKDIGRGFKKQGIYKDEDIGLLKQAYRQISDDQQKVAEAFGVGDDYALGRKLVGDRKRIEDQSKALFGREVNKSLIPQLKAAGTAMTKGDVSKFEKLIDSLPKSMREEAAVTMLGDLFVQDARSATGISQGFVKAFEGLNRNKEAKNVLFKHIPIEGRKRFNNIGKVATGLYRSKALENTSKTARDLIAAMEDGGMFRRITDVGGKVAAAESVTSTVGMPGVGAAGVIGSVLTKSRKSSSKAADEFITSKKFTEAVKEAAEGNLKNADETIKKSKYFKEWIKHVNPGDVEAIMTIGFIPWVTGNTEEKEQPGVK